MNTQPARWQLEPPGTGARVFLLLVTLLLPVGITAAALGHVFATSETLRLIGDSKALTATVTIAGIALACAAMWWLLHRSLGRHRITLDDAAIEIATTFHRRRLALDQLRLDEARVVDLDERTEFKPILKTLGTSFPGLRSGWFRLRNRNKALVACVGGTRLAWIPTRAGYDLLLQPRHPQALLDELRRMADRPPRR